ncbi:MAG TPA: FGGY-family carbohydrate kinase, partial [Solirubrobacteraceae bacterium]|nr:FGGY-family carbohydrate kinase [Solirubrobacteraceae bacterium]
LTAFAGAGHLARAVLEATAWQTREVLDAANEIAGVELSELRVDGGMTANELLMQLQADVLGIPVLRPEAIETTSLGAAYAAGLTVGFWSGQAELRERSGGYRRWEPAMDRARREREYGQWKKAVERSLGWVE